MDVNEILKQLTLEEKACLVTGAASMGTFSVERLGVPQKSFADGPHGVREADSANNCTHFPNACCVGASWDRKAAHKMGEGLADDCIKHGIDMLLGPGMNIKRNILCGRNFEYYAEDPVLAGELAAEYIKGIQSKGVAASLKHFAVNSQEVYRTQASAEVDERVLREIYLRGFEIAVKKGKPASVMCAYNKVNSIWCSENKFLLNDVLKEEWGYEGYVVSDWGAVHDICRALCAGLDLQMPKNDKIVDQIEAGLASGALTMETLDAAVARVLKFALKPKAEKTPYDRDKQHKAAAEIAAAGITLLKNENNILPLTEEKYKKISVIGEFAESPLICGQGSAEVYPKPEYIDSPLAELKKRLPNTEIQYREYFKKREFSSQMLWPLLGEYHDFIRDSDVVVIFAGSMESEDTEFFDRRDAKLNPNYEMFISYAQEANKNVVVVLQSGGALILGDFVKTTPGIVQMWLGGEAAGSAIADVLCGKVNPSGKLPETFPTCLRTDLDYPGDGQKIKYAERLDVGYRYYDRHTDEIVFPFGHGLSYTEFSYENMKTAVNGDEIEVSFDLTNSGKTDGAEVYQVYVSDLESTVSKPIKELKQFDKMFLKAGETKRISFTLTKRDLAYYNVMLHDWVAERGEYKILIGASSQDIRLCDTVYYDADMPYSMDKTNEGMIG